MARSKFRSLSDRLLRSQVGKPDEPDRGQRDASAHEKGSARAESGVDRPGDEWTDDPRETAARLVGAHDAASIVCLRLLGSECGGTRIERAHPHAAERESETGQR